MVKRFAGLVLILAAAALLTTGCGPRMARTVVGAAIVGAAVGTAVAVHRSHHHFHHVNCGCPRRWDRGHWEYYYEGGWEYYDPHAGVWYRYE